MNKPLIRLYEHVGTGLIIKQDSGVIYSNQTCGTCCLQPQQEGVFVPLSNDFAVPSGLLLSKVHDLRRYFTQPPYLGTGAMAGLTERDAEFIEGLFGEPGNLKFMRVDRDRLRESHEAWVHVLLDAHEYSPYAGFEPYPIEAILTWNNTD